MEVTLSLHSARTEVARLQGELADLNRKIASETAKLSDVLRKKNDVQRTMQYKMSPSQALSKSNELECLMKDQSNIQKIQSELEKKVSSKKSKIARSQDRLDREELANRKRQDQIEKKRRIEQELYIRKADAVLSNINREIINYNENNDATYDVFISHASEDKEDFVRPLADSLRNQGIRVWYDEFSLKWGDGLRRSIDRGLSNSRFGIVVLSVHFFNKEWPQRELDGLFALEIGGRARILPIWHKISKDEVRTYSPILADKMALNTATHDISEINSRLTGLMQPETPKS